MWNKRREDEPAKPYAPSSGASPGHVSPASVAPNPLEAKKESATMSSTPVGRYEPETRASTGGSASIGKAVRIVGQIYSKEDLYVDGDLEGTVEALEFKLTIGPNGTLHASIKAREVVVLGTLQGNVEASEKIEIRKEAKLVGDIRTARIIIEDGAYFKGSIDIVKPEPAKPAQKPQQAVQAAASQAPVPAGSTDSKR